MPTGLFTKFTFLINIVVSQKKYLIFFIVSQKKKSHHYNKETDRIKILSSKMDFLVRTDTSYNPVTAIGSSLKFCCLDLGRIGFVACIHEESSKGIYY